MRSELAPQKLLRQKLVSDTCLKLKTQSPGLLEIEEPICGPDLSQPKPLAQRASRVLVHGTLFHPQINWLSVGGWGARTKLGALGAKYPTVVSPARGRLTFRPKDLHLELNGRVIQSCPFDAQSMQESLLSFGVLLRTTPRLMAPNDI